ISIPPLVTQIGDGENGGVMMNEFPSGYRQGIHRCGTEGTVAVNVTEYLEMIEQAGGREHHPPPGPAPHPGQGFAPLTQGEPGAADKAIAEVKREKPHFNLEGGSWTNNISWVRGYENLLTPMNKLSARFHEVLDNRAVDRNSHAYRNALYHLLVAETSCF